MSLFSAPRTLVLELVDAATSDDPMEIYLQRRGWSLRRVQVLQHSISAKLTPDLFTRETQPLSGAEVMLRDDIDKFIRQAYSGTRQTAERTP